MSFADLDDLYDHASGVFMSHSSPEEPSSCCLAEGNLLFGLERNVPSTDIDRNQRLQRMELDILKALKSLSQQLSAPVSKVPDEREIEASTTSDSRAADKMTSQAKHRTPAVSRPYTLKRLARTTADEIQVAHVITWLEEEGLQQDKGTGLEAKSARLQQLFGIEAMSRQKLSKCLDGQILTRCVECDHKTFASFCLDHIGERYPASNEQRQCLIHHGLTTALALPCFGGVNPNHVLFVGELSVNMYTRQTRQAHCEYKIENPLGVAVTVFVGFSPASTYSVKMSATRAPGQTADSISSFIIDAITEMRMKGVMRGCRPLVVVETSRIDEVTAISKISQKFDVLCISESNPWVNIAKILLACFQPHIKQAAITFEEPIPSSKNPDQQLELRTAWLQRLIHSAWNYFESDTQQACNLAAMETQ